VTGPPGAVAASSGRRPSCRAVLRVASFHMRRRLRTIWDHAEIVPHKNPRQARLARPCARGSRWRESERVLWSIRASNREFHRNRVATQGVMQRPNCAQGVTIRALGARREIPASARNFRKFRIFAKTSPPRPPAPTILPPGPLHPDLQATRWGNSRRPLSGLPIRGHEFPRSHGPPEDTVNRQRLTNP
jgi:hypothetical protein